MGHMNSSLTIPDHMKPLQELMIQLIDDLIRINSIKQSKLFPVSFWFYSAKESSLGSLSDILKDHGYCVSVTQIFEDNKSTWLCIARIDLLMDHQLLSNLSLRLRVLADTYSVEYRGWEIILPK